MNVCVRGPILSISGYGNHSRQVFRWLYGSQSINVSSQILPWGMTPWYINPNDQDGLIGTIMKTSYDISQKKNFDVSFQIQLPNEWDHTLAQYNVGVSTFVETDICNPAWLAACNRMNLIIVPTLHVKETIERSGRVSTPIAVVPESFPDSILATHVDPIDLNVKTKFNFLIFGQLTSTNAYQDRKNTYLLVKWLSEVFANDPDVGIIIKTNHGTNSTVDRALVRSIMERVIQEIGKHPPIYLLHGAMNDQEIAALYRHESIKGLISATRGEGFGLPLLEAAASGLPVLATNWSGHLDFLNQGKWIKFDYELETVPKEKIDGNIFVEGSKWAEVIESDFKKKVMKFKKKPSIPNSWAKDLRKMIIESNQFNAIARQYDTTMETYLK